MDVIETPDIGSSLLKGTIWAIIIITLLLVLFLRRDAFSQLGNLLSNGFGWFSR